MQNTTSCSVLISSLETVNIKSKVGKLMKLFKQIERKGSVQCADCRQHIVGFVALYSDLFTPILGG